MEDKIYQVLRKHRLPLKKREELLPDLLALFNVDEDAFSPLDQCKNWHSRDCECQVSCGN